MLAQLATVAPAQQQLVAARRDVADLHRHVGLAQPQLLLVQEQPGVAAARDDRDLPERRRHRVLAGERHLLDREGQPQRQHVELGANEAEVVEGVPPGAGSASPSASPSPSALAALGGESPSPSASASPEPSASPSEAERLAAEAHARELAAAQAAADAKAKATADKLTADAQTADPSKVGYLIANTEPWARVVIDGKDTGMMTPIAPRSKIPLKPGKHTVTFVIDGQKFKFGIVIVAGEDYRLIKTLEVAAP